MRTKVIGVIALLLSAFCFAFAGNLAADAVSGSPADSATLAPGADGQAGAAGADGSDGPDGRDGVDGADSAGGLDGADGSNGVRGGTGLAGATGPVGPRGVAGQNGASGATGLPGAAGPKGDTGAAGAKGDTGSRGPAGADGADGRDGADGADAQLDFRSYTAAELTVTRGSGLTVVVEPNLPPGTWLLGATVRNMTGNAFYGADACRFDGTGPSGRAHVPYEDTVTLTTVWDVTEVSSLTFGCSVGGGAVFESRLGHLTVWAIKLSD